jgi:hypothetical protein
MEVKDHDRPDLGKYDCQFGNEDFALFRWKEPYWLELETNVSNFLD